MEKKSRFGHMGCFTFFCSKKSKEKNRLIAEGIRFGAYGPKIPYHGEHLQFYSTTNNNNNVDFVAHSSIHSNNHGYLQGNVPYSDFMYQGELPLLPVEVKQMEMDKIHVSNRMDEAWLPLPVQPQSTQPTLNIVGQDNDKKLDFMYQGELPLLPIKVKQMEIDKIHLSNRMDEAWLPLPVQPQSTQPTLNVVGQDNDKKLLTGHMSSLMMLIQVESVWKWSKILKEKRKEETQLQTAQVAEAAAALATFVVGKTPHPTKIDVAFASAAALVAAQCIEMASITGAHNLHISSAVNSTLSYKTTADIQTLTTAAATSLREAEMLKPRTARAHAMVARREQVKAYRWSPLKNLLPRKENNISFADSQDILVKGTQLLTRIQNGKPQWKTVSAYLNKKWQVMLKLKTKKLRGAITTSKECLVLELLLSVGAWPSSRANDGGDHLIYFGLKTSSGIVEFQFKDEFNHQIWTFSISQLLKLSYHKNSM